MAGISFFIRAKNRESEAGLLHLSFSAIYHSGYSFQIQLFPNEFLFLADEML